MATDSVPSASDPSTEPHPVRIAISDPRELPALDDLLGSVHGLSVEREGQPPDEQELGASDILVGVASSSAVVAMIKILPEFLRARRADITVKIRLRDRDIDIKADSAEHAAALIRQALDR